MALSSDQLAKVKNDIKNKLTEMGSYVDDQLTDYIMIMLTNKKTERQIADDLELFLGGSQEASNFSAWLFNLIKKTTSSKRRTSSTSASDVPKKESPLDNAASTLHRHPSSAVTQQSTTDELALQIDSNEFNEEPTKNVEVEKKAEAPVVPPQQPQAAASISEPKRKSAVSSFIGAVITHGTGESSSSADRDRDKSRRLRHSDSSSNGKPIKSILSKAVDEANASVQQKKPHLQRKNSGGDDDGETRSSSDIRQRLGPIPTNREPRRIELFTQSYRQRHGNNSKRSRSNSYDQEEGESKPRRTAIIVSSQEQDNTGGERVEPSFKKRAAAEDSPKFIVTLGDKKITPIEFTEEDRIKLSRRITTTSNTYKNRRERFQQQSVEEDSVPLSVTLEPEEDEMMNLDDQQPMEEGAPSAATVIDGTTNNMVPHKKPIRCTFWPACDKGDSCQFIHPNKPCTAFPNCPFGQQCHYLHPPCHFDGKCTKYPECPYTHIIQVSKPKPQAHFPPAAVASGEESINVAGGGGGAPKVIIDKIHHKYVAPTATTEKSDSEVTGATNEATMEPASAASTTAGFNIAPRPNVYSINKLRPASSPQTRSFLPQKAHQFSLINNAAINCKYGSHCKNPNCVFVHPANTALPQSQFKWTAPTLITAAETAAAAPVPSSEMTEAQATN